jgi:hypothetical protein
MTGRSNHIPVRTFRLPNIRRSTSWHSPVIPPVQDWPEEVTLRNDRRRSTRGTDDGFARRHQARGASVGACSRPI